MKVISKPEDAINSTNIKPGSVIYASGNAAPAQELLLQLARDLTIKDIDLYSILLLGERLKPLFSEERCQSLTHRVIFNSHLTRRAVNKGWAKYHPMHLSEVPKYIRTHVKPNIVILTVSGPDPAGNYSLGTTVEGVPAAIQAARRQGGLIIAEHNRQMPFVLGSTIPRDYIDYLLEKASIEEIICIETENKIECELAQRLGNILAWVPGFGASDCKCKSHLYFAKNKSTLKKKIKEIFVKWGPHYSVKYSEEFNLAGKGKNDRS